MNYNVGSKGEKLIPAASSQKTAIARVSEARACSSWTRPPQPWTTHPQRGSRICSKTRWKRKSSLVPWFTAWTPSANSTDCGHEGREKSLKWAATMS